MNKEHSGVYPEKSLKKIFTKGTIFILSLFLVGILFASLVSAGYLSSNPNLISSQSSAFARDVYDTTFDNSMCSEGQDFVIQIDPLGCSPTVVRSDLLEEQDVPVFCELKAYKINPLIDIDSISSIKFSGEYPPEVKTVGFHAANSALGQNNELNSVFLGGIGYAVIVLKQQPNESAISDYISGNLTATITYDLKDAFGIRYPVFYLPVLDDSVFDKNLGYYSFWNKRGYLRVEDIQEGEATIALYSGSYRSVFGNSKEGEIRHEKFGTFKLEEGEKTRKLYLPGMDCFAGLELKLDEIEYADTTVQLKINQDYIQVKKGEGFLDGKCRVDGTPEKNGIYEKVNLKCEEDSETNSFALALSPQVDLMVNGISRNYEIGDLVGLSEDEKKFVYVGAIKTKENSHDEEDLLVYLVGIPTKNEKIMDDGTGRLTDEGREALIESQLYKMDYSATVIGSVAQVGIGAAKLFSEFAFGTEIITIKYGEPEKPFGIGFAIEGFSDSSDSMMDEGSSKNYLEAIDEYDEIIESYSSEVYETLSLAEEASYNKILLANDLSQKSNVLEFCDAFKSAYPNSERDLVFCEDNYMLSNSESSTREVVVDGNLKRISFQGIREPSKEDYGVEIFVENSTGQSNSYFLEKNQLVDIDSGASMKLVSIENTEEVKLEVSFKRDSTSREARDYLVGNVYSFKKGILRPISDYKFNVYNINVNKVAKVSVHPTLDYSQSKANFGFNVGVEKRNIQLSPEKISDRIKNLNETNEKIEKISAGLETVVKGMKTACLVTGGFLTAKNLIANAGGKSIARSQVMNGAGGWKERCADREYGGTQYRSVDECYIDKADDIDAEVEAYHKAMKSQNDEIKKIQNEKLIGGDKFLGKDVNTTAFVEDYSGEVILDLKDYKSEYQIEYLLDADNFEERNYNLDQLKEIQLYHSLANSKDPAVTGESKAIYAKRLNQTLFQIQKNSDLNLARDISADQKGIDSSHYAFIKLGENPVEIAYSGLTADKVEALSGKTGIENSDPVQVLYTSNSTEYIAVLEDKGTGVLPIAMIGGTKAIYNFLGTQVTEYPKEFDSIYFRKYDSASYNNPYKDEEIKYYETEPFKGLPQIVPFDLKNGWYAYVRQNLPVSTTIRSYDDSGRVNSFFICNVGPDGLQDYSSCVGTGAGDDFGQLINLGTGQPYNQFPGMETSEAKNLIDRAVRAVYDAKGDYDNGVQSVTILGEKIKVGSPAINNPGIECTDFMSPKECNLIFNLCDPVICPTSRCDFGGAYPVNDVVQSGVIGSLVLCYHNSKFAGGTNYIPVCLTGVQAGLDGYLSVSKSYQDCLQENLETGKTVGICDEIHSIYMCEFFWRQALPLGKILIPKLMSSIFKQNSRGGGEYLGVDTAWASMQDSVSYFTSYYAVNSAKAFKARNAESVGTEICKLSMSAVVPTSGGIFDVLTEPDSPVQYNARFDEIPFTIATNPPISQYKVFYHIYAGKDQGAYYKVYLRGGSSSYYEDTSLGRSVASDYIPAGEYKTETLDFTAPAGYKELCVNVNGIEDCGFSKVSSSFAVDYMKDQYIIEQTNVTDIKTESECISGTASLYSLLNPNLQEAAGDLIDNQLYNKGIIRICSYENPGLGSDLAINTPKQRWFEVGTCGNPNLKCWLDKTSIPGAMEFENNSGMLLDDLTKQHTSNLINSDLYLDEIEYKNALVNISKNLTKIEDKIEALGKLFDKVYLGNHKANLHLLRGRLYGSLASEFFGEYVKTRKENTERIVEEFDFGFISSTFELELDSGKMCFRYYDGVWHWSDAEDCEDAGREIIPTRAVGGIAGGGSPSLQSVTSFVKYPWRDLNYFLNSYGEELSSEEQKNILHQLNEKKDFRNGFEYLLRLTHSEKDAVFKNNVAIYEDRVFLIDDVEEVDKIYLKFETNKWVWGYTDKVWHSVDEIKEKSRTSAGTGFRFFIQSSLGITPDIENVQEEESVEMPLQYQNLIKKLKEVENQFIEGSLIIFSGIESDLVETPGVSSSEAVMDRISSLDNSMYDDLIFKYSEIYGVEPSLVKAVMAIESKFNTYAVSGTGAAGLMQFTSPTAGDYSDIFGTVTRCTTACTCSYQCTVEDVVNKCGCKSTDGRFDPEKSINAGAKYLASLMNMFSTYPDSEELTLASYNGGQGLIKKAVEDFKSENNLITNEQATWEKVKGELGVGTFRGFNDYNSWDGGDIQSKIEEISNYVDKVMEKRNEYLENLGVYADYVGADESSSGYASLDIINALILEVSELEGDYSDNQDNKDFVDSLYNFYEVIFLGEYNEIVGESWYNSEEDMEFVEELLKKKRDEILAEFSDNFNGFQSESFLRSEEPIEVVYEPFVVNFLDSFRGEFSLIPDSLQIEGDSLISICEMDSLMNEICMPLDTNDLSNIGGFPESVIMLEILGPYQGSQENFMFEFSNTINPDPTGVVDTSDISIIDSLIVTESDSIEPVENVEVEITLPDSSVVGGISDSLGNINLVPIEESERRDETENQVSENSGLSYEEFSSALRSASLSLSQFSVEERSLFQTVNVCSECGSSSFFDSCDEDECKAIGLKLQRNCVFENNNLWFGGDCVYQNVLETEEEIILRSEDSIEIFYESFELNVQDNSQIQVPLMIDSIEFDQDSSICEFDSLMNEICRPLDTNDVSNVFEYNEEDIVVEVLNPYQVSQDNLIFTPYMFLHPDSAGVLEISDISIIDSLIVTESDSIEPVENVEVEITLPDSSVVGGISDSLGMIEVEVSLNPDSIQGTEILNELREEFTFDSAINYILANNLFGDYSDSLKNEEFVEWIYSDGLINSEEYRDIIGKGLFNSEEDMEFVEVLLLEKILIGQEIIESSEVIQEQLEDSICSADTSSKECEEIIVTEVNKVEEEVCTKKDSLEECVVKLEVFIPENFGLFLEEIPKTLTGKTIVIDPGHGGYDSGAVGFGEIYESNLALSYSLLLKSELEKRGATIYMTRNSDVGIGTDQQSSLAKRKEFTKEKNPDYFVSVHFNSVENSSKKINKTEILIRGLAKENTVGVLDSCLIEDCKSYHSPSNSLAKVIKGNLRGVSEIIIFGSDVNVLYDNGADKSILYEINYINHEEMVEYVQVDSVKEKYVGAIVQAMIAENNFDESGSCTNYESCQKILGESVYSIASSSAKEKGISDSKILEETGFKSFGCLILGIAMQESSIRHCEGFFSEGNPLYCDESRENVLVSSSEDIGVMQIHSNPLIPAYVDPYDFYDNVGYASTLFNDKYLSGLKYPGGREYTCLDKTYSGWNLALRYYNGWSPKDCSKGDKDYVENVLSHSDEIESLFPELCSV